MKISVIGAGAIGSLVAGYLAEKGEEITLIGRSQQVEVISRNGLSIDGVRGQLLVNLTVRPNLDERPDLVILATKTQDLEQAISQNLSYLKNTPILTIQNGMRAESLIAKTLGEDKLFSSIVMFGATYLAAGKAVHNFEGDWILGKFAQGSNGFLADIQEHLQKAFACPIARDIKGMKWLKLFLNANNCLPALLDQSMQQAFKNIEICKVSLKIWQEGLSLVSQAQIGLVSLPSFPAERIKNLVNLPLDKSAAIFSGIMTTLSKEPLYGSILQSIKRDRSSEIDYINGEFVNLAQSLGQSAPLNERLVQLVHQLEQNKRFLSEQELINQTKEFLN